MKTIVLILLPCQKLPEKFNLNTFHKNTGLKICCFSYFDFFFFKTAPEAPIILCTHRNNTVAAI